MFLINGRCLGGSNGKVIGFVLSLPFYRWWRQRMMRERRIRQKKVPPSFYYLSLFATFHDQLMQNNSDSAK